MDFFPCRSGEGRGQPALSLLHCCTHFWAGEIFVGSFVGQKKPRRSIAPALCLSRCIFNRPGLDALLNHFIVLSDEADVLITGRLEPTFQPQTVVAGGHDERC